jgi:hypothetical protein
MNKAEMKIIRSNGRIETKGFTQELGNEVKKE